MPAAFVYWRAGAKMTGASVAALFLVLGFGLFGKNLLNVWPIVAGVALYARFRGEPFRAHLNTAFFGGALAPIFSEILFSTDLTPMVSVPARSRDRACGRLHSSARGRAPLPGAYGLQPLQYGVHGGHRRHDRRRDVQGVWLRARPCLHLDKRGEQTSRHISRPRLRLDGRRRLGLRPERARTSADHSEDVGPVSDRLYCACRLRRDARQYGARRSDRRRLRPGDGRGSQWSLDWRDPDDRRLRGVRKASAQHRAHHDRRFHRALWRAQPAPPIRR